jgi:hypothetical protein
MTRRTAESLLAATFWLAFLLAFSTLLCNWSVCEQDDRLCLITGVESK